MAQVHRGTENNHPLVSCIMPTCDRLEMVQNAIDLFHRQDYANKELLILDSGCDELASVVNHSQNVRIFADTDVRSLGEMRNYLCKRAKGEWIAIWDDDDWHAPNRLSVQVHEAESVQADLCGMDHLVYWDPATRNAFRYAPQLGGQGWLAGGSLLFRKSVWEQTPFVSVSVGEDTLFVAAHGDRRWCVIKRDDLYVARIHAGNTSPKRTWGRLWKPYPAAVVQQRIKRWTVDAKVLVSIPVYNCPTTLRRAVESILSQSYRNLICVVSNDGGPQPWSEIADIDDARLIRFDMERNRGRYFADQVALQSIESAYFAVQDADDWSDPDRIKTLMNVLEDEQADVVVCATHHHRMDGSTQVQKPRLPASHQSMTHFADHFGLFRTQALLDVGGYYAGFRLGFDTYLLNLFRHLGRIAVCDQPLYHRVHRPGSLVYNAATGLGSQARRQTASALSKLLEQAKLRMASGDREQLKQLHRGRMTSAELDDLEQECNRLAEVATTRKFDAHRSGIPRNDITGPWDDWCLSSATMEVLLARLKERRPQSILELGSGYSTLELAQYVREHGGSLVTLEHDKVYYQRTKQRLLERDLAANVELVYAPLQDLRLADGSFSPMYGNIPQRRYDHVVIDGPPQRLGRAATFWALKPFLSEDFEIWLDDANRDHEKECVRRWCAAGDLDVTYRNIGKGAFVLTPVSKTWLVLTLLTGGRPDLLAQTLESIKIWRQDARFKAMGVALVNGGDRESRGLVQRSELFQEYLLEDAYLPIGIAYTKLVNAAASLGGRYQLHLEDDWQCTDTFDQLITAKSVLEVYPSVGQVRLRASHESVLRRHMVSGRDIEWQRRDGFMLSESAHFTFNPSLVRLEDVRKIIPAQGESDAQVHFYQRGYHSAQLTPGLFEHLGEQTSLRKALHR